MSSLSRSASAPLRMRSRYNSVLESALVGLGREDAVVHSTRKKHCYDASRSPVRGLAKALSAPEQRPQICAKEDEDPFASSRIIKLLKKKKKQRAETEKRPAVSPAVTRSATKLQRRRQARRHVGVLEMVEHTPVTRSMTRANNKRSSLEMIEDVEPNDEDATIRKTLVFSSPEPKNKKRRKETATRHNETRGRTRDKERNRASRKAVVLRHWRIVWPLKLEAGSEKVAMEISGFVDREVRQFAVGKREGAVKFTSKDGTYVALRGKMDRQAAKSAGIPRAVTKLVADGIPPFFRKRLRPFVVHSITGKAPKAVALRKVATQRGSATGKTSLLMPDNKVTASASNKAIRARNEDPHERSKAKKGREQEIESPSRPFNVISSCTSQQSHRLVQDESKRVYMKNSEVKPEPDVWTNEQLQTLFEAKLQIPTTALNYWMQVAHYVPGKSAQECQAKTFEHFRSPPTSRKTTKKPSKRRETNLNAAERTKIARAGSNKFKKQVREFVEEYEKKHVDDVFNTTPSKEGLPELPEFGAIKSPELATPSQDEDSDEEAPDLLKKLSSRRRDDIDSYVLGINRQHVAGGGKLVGGKVRRVPAMSTARATTTLPKKKAVVLEEDVGSHSMKAVVSPGGTTRVRIDRNSSASENEDYESSEGEEDFDIP